MKEITPNINYQVETTVTEALLAKTVGSGDVSVYATPMMIALMEEAASKCLLPFLDEGETSVGIMIQTTHSAATPLEMQVTASAEITAVDGKKVTFSVVACDEKEVIGIAVHERVIVQKQKFEQRTAEKKA